MFGKDISSKVRENCSIFPSSFVCIFLLSDSLPVICIIYHRFSVGTEEEKINCMVTFIVKIMDVSIVTATDRKYEKRTMPGIFRPSTQH